MNPSHGQPGQPRRVAILGAGYIAEYHMDALQRADGVELVAVCDLSRSRAEALAKAHGGQTVYTDLDEMLSAERLDVVHVLLPPELHYRLAVRVLEAGVDLFLEKPMCISAKECEDLIAVAKRCNRRVGVNHNFLFFPVYERLGAIVRDGTLGKLDQVDVVWNKELPQIVGGPHGVWMFAKPENILTEIGPHSFAHVLDLVGPVTDLRVEARDRVELSNGLEFYRRWEIMGWSGTTSVRLRFSFIDGYPDHYVRVRGSNGVATADFERNVYSCQMHTAQPFDLDRYTAVASTAKDTLSQARTTLRRLILSKMGVDTIGKPFPESFDRSIEAYYRPADDVDARLSTSLATATLQLSEGIAKAADYNPPRRVVASGADAPPVDADADASGSVTKVSEPEPGKSRVLVLGGTGFIGSALCLRLREQGHAVRVLSRKPADMPAGLRAAGVEALGGSFADKAAIEAALQGVQQVYHLARGYGTTWEEYQRFDVEPTRQLAELCVAHGVKRLHYASSIAIYHAGRRAGRITEDTRPHKAIMRCNLYARAKVECEQLLLDMAKPGVLEVVIFRPGIVVGPGGSPYHWGVGMWPYKSVCRLWGDGNSPLPFVLVDDVADAMARAVEAEGVSGQSYNLVGGPDVTANDYLDAFERHAGLKIQRIPTSAWRYYGEDMAKWVIKTIGRDPGRRLPSLADYDGRTSAAPFDASKARSDLGWTPNEDLAEFLRQGIEAPVEKFLR